VDALEVIDGGFFTTVQDLGRYGYQRYGVPVSGAMDTFALRAANLLAGNPRSAAALEMTLTGARLRFLTDTVIAVAGADMQPRLDDWPVPMWHPVAASDGAVLTFGATRDGLRAYLAIAGGIDVPVVLGSRSTFPRAGLGGFQGRPIRAGDVLATCGDPPTRVEGRMFPRERILSYAHHHSIRVILGPQDDAFTAEGIATFFSATYVVTPKSDRIGCRLEGPKVSHQGSPDIISDGVPFGAVQIAGDGLPMILVADRGTTGGYAKLATVISADLPRLAQALPGDRVAFRAVSLDEAHRAVEEEEGVLDRISRSPPMVFARTRLEVRVDGEPFRVALGLHEQATGEKIAEPAKWSVQAIGDGKATTMEVTIADAPDRAPR
jgi:antagonist of KipI